MPRQHTPAPSLPGRRPIFRPPRACLDDFTIHDETCPAPTTSHPQVRSGPQRLSCPRQASRHATSAASLLYSCDYFEPCHTHPRLRDYPSPDVLYPNQPSRRTGTGPLLACPPRHSTPTRPAPDPAAPCRQANPLPDRASLPAATCHADPGQTTAVSARAQIAIGWGGSGLACRYGGISARDGMSSRPARAGADRGGLAGGWFGLSRGSG